MTVHYHNSVRQCDHCLPLLNPFIIIIKSLDPLTAKKTFIRKKLGHTMVSAINNISLYKKMPI